MTSEGCLIPFAKTESGFVWNWLRSQPNDKCLLIHISSTSFHFMCDSVYFFRHGFISCWYKFIAEKIIMCYIKIEVLIIFVGSFVTKLCWKLIQMKYKTKQPLHRPVRDPLEFQEVETPRLQDIWHMKVVRL